ncbi:MAG: glutamate--tRNA ligase [Acidobacteriota bacterium]|nr:glutamate--tRNA ligase [Blastocatellia bacterium]MDW8240429.1 glutamate--tRNA ligase [Acidobacteriota bacterium]
MTDIRVRFAPSPTGFLHVGGARTALFNWLFARKHHGTFILRIEDTDAERSSSEMVEGILEGLRWLELDWDEGPYFQSQRLPLYQQTAHALVESGHAYYCFCSPQELAIKRQRALQQKRDAQYDRACRSLTNQEIQSKLDAGAPRAIRFKVPLEGTTQFDDVVFGRIQVQNAMIEDFVLLRSDGHPTYHLSVVVDDAQMRISHVIRGADHLSNTPKQVLLYQALGLSLPCFTHLPLILGPDRTRLSKRHGATSVTAYRDMGFLPEAFRNFLALLGWSPGASKQELFTTPELIAAFSLEGISKTNAIFDPDKALWVNAQHLGKMSTEALIPFVRSELIKANLWNEAYAGEQRQWFCQFIELLKSRARTLTYFVEAGRPYLSDDFTMQPEAVAQNLSRPELKELLPELAHRYEQLDSFTLESTEAVLRQLAAERGLKAGILINAVRTALTGSAATPGIFDVIVTIGQQRTALRLRQATRWIS